MYKVIFIIFFNVILNSNALSLDFSDNSYDDYSNKFTSGFINELPQLEIIDESKFEQNVVLDKDNVYRLKIYPKSTLKHLKL